MDSYLVTPYVSPVHRRLRIFQRDGFECRFCGEDDVVELSLDHIIPRSLGGDDSEGNLWTLCSYCNGAKGVKVMPFQLRLQVAEPCSQCGSRDHGGDYHYGQRNRRHPAVDGKPWDEWVRRYSGATR